MRPQEKVHQSREDRRQHVSIFEKLLEKVRTVSLGKYTSLRETETVYGKLPRSILLEPTEQPPSNDISVIMRQKVDLVVW